MFLDRDGTLIEERFYPCHPDEIVLQPGVCEPLRALQHEGAVLVVVTNQSGLARGLFDDAALEAMHSRLLALLSAEDVHLDGIYVCPHHPEGKIAGLAIACACRKPEPGMLHRASRELSLDLPASWMVGNTESDVEAGLRAGSRTALVGAAAGVVSNANGLFAPDLQLAATAETLVEIHRRLIR